MRPSAKVVGKGYNKFRKTRWVTGSTRFTKTKKTKSEAAHTVVYRV